MNGNTGKVKRLSKIITTLKRNSKKRFQQGIIFEKNRITNLKLIEKIKYLFLKKG